VAVAAVRRYEGGQGNCEYDGDLVTRKKKFMF
jgi:hypothetical protein